MTWYAQEVPPLHPRRVEPVHRLLCYGRVVSVANATGVYSSSVSIPVLKNVLQFSGLVVGVPTSLPHLLRVNDVPVAPQLILPLKGGYTVTADITNVTVTRLTGSATLTVYVEHWHTIETVLPETALALPAVLDPGAPTGAFVDRVMWGPWIEENTQQNQTNHILTLGATGTADMATVPRDGSLTAITVHIDNGPIVAGSIDVLFVKNNVVTANKVTINVGATTVYGTFAIGAIGLAAGDIIGTAITSSNPLNPNNAIHIAVFLEQTLTQ